MNIRYSFRGQTGSAKDWVRSFSQDESVVGGVDVRGEDPAEVLVSGEKVRDVGDV